MPGLRRPPSSTPSLYEQDGKGYDALVYAHYFVGDNDWLVTEYDPADDIAFGWVCLNGDRQNAELGYMSLVEMESVKAPIRVYIEGHERLRGHLPLDYELDWQPVPLKDAIALLDKRQGRS